MRIRLTKLDDRRHALEIERDDRSRERVELETRSSLHHDLTHFAVEQAAGMQHGFFGSLAAGKTLAELSGSGPAAPEYTGAMLAIERAVAVLQGMAKSDEPPGVVYERIVALLAAQEASPPAWFTRALVADVHERLRRLLGQWKATPYGKTMELPWTP